MVIDRQAATLPPLPTAEIDVPEIGGTVTIRSLLLTERLDLSRTRAADAVPKTGETDEDAIARASRAAVIRTLAMVVLASDGKPLWSGPQWDQFGAVHLLPALTLFNEAMRLSGADIEGERKN